MYAQERVGADFNYNAVVAYKLEKDEALPIWYSKKHHAQFDWWTGTKWHTVKTICGGSSGWYGICVEGDAGWQGLTSTKRCVKLVDFTVNSGSNGAHFTDSTSAGNTRCNHRDHWPKFDGGIKMHVRPCEDATRVGGAKMTC